jgi:surface protein
MESMFRGASLFNRDVTAWTTSNVVNMKSAFEDGKAFNQDLSKWLVSKGTVISLFFC